MAKTLSLMLGVLALLVTPLAAAAHGGHGASHPGDSAAHYLTEPEHVLVTLLAIGLAGVGVAFLGRLRPLRSTRDDRR